MTKQDYIKLAKLIKENSTTDIEYNGCIVYRTKIVYIRKDNLLDNFCTYLKSNNPRFDEETFRKACEY
jgi:hypothetical protein